MLVSKPSKHSPQRLLCRATRFRSVEIANHADQLRVALIATGGITRQRPGQTPLPSLPDHTFRVDDEVVGDVVPTLIRAGVEVEPSSQDIGGVGAGVSVVRG